MNANYNFQRIDLIWVDFKLLSYLTRHTHKTLEISPVSENCLCHFMVL